MHDVRGDGERRQPLWASSLAEQPRVDEAELGVPERPAEPEPAVARPLPQQTRRLLVLAALTAVVATAVAGRLVAQPEPALASANVSSNWGPIAMRCDTTRVVFSQRVVELFECRTTVGAADLPVGEYTFPDAQWTSDIDRRDAIFNRIEITSGDAMTGWAIYR